MPKKTKQPDLMAPDHTETCTTCGTACSWSKWRGWLTACGHVHTTRDPRQAAKGGA